MFLSERETWTVIHGMGLGALFLLSIGGGLVELWSLRPEWLTTAGLSARLPRLIVGTWTMAIVDWLAVITGTYIVYPWYRATPPPGTVDLIHFPRTYLLANPALAQWHTFGMEWKEHIAWLSPILATAVALVVTRYRAQLAEEEAIRNAVIVLFVIAFVTAGIAGILGAFITKVVPIH